MSARPYMYWLDLEQGIIRIESPTMGYAWKIYKANGTSWTEIYTSDTDAYWINVDVASLNLTENTTIIARQFGVGMSTVSPDSNELYVVVENWTEESSYIVSVGKTIITNVNAVGNILRNITRSIVANSNVSSVLNRVSSFIKSILTNANVSSTLPTRQTLKNIIVQSSLYSLINRAVNKTIDVQSGISSMINRGYFKTLQTSLIVTALRQIVADHTVYFKTIIASIKINGRISKRDIVRNIIVNVNISSIVRKYITKIPFVTSIGVIVNNIRTIIFGGVLHYKIIVANISVAGIIQKIKNIFTAIKKSPKYKWEEMKSNYSWTELQLTYIWKELD